MASRLARAVPFVAVVAAVLLLTYATGCRKGAVQAPEAEDAAARSKKAGAAFRDAQGAPIPEKYERFRRVIALYDDTSSGRDSYLELVVALVHDVPPRTGEALAVARAMRDRHPTDHRVSESFLQVADTAYWTKDDALRTAALEDWSRYLEARDVAGDVPKPRILAEFVKLRLRQERWSDAEVAIDTALAEAELAKVERVEILVSKASLLAHKLGDKTRARAALHEALRLAREVHAGAAGRRGFTPAQIEEEIQKLGA